MNNKYIKHIVNLLFPCLIFAVITGFFSAIYITGFKLLAEWVIHLSLTAYDFVRNNPEWLPLLILAVAIIGLIASLILCHSHTCRGGGIPTSIAAIRGIVNFKWLAAIILLPISSSLTFLAGLPLGTEGPCVQLGTAIGDGVIKCIGKEKYKGWHRYIMTGGASAGFSIATSAPISAIVFSMEELHKHFSPLLLSVVSVSVLTAQATTQLLASFGIGSVVFFHMPQIESLAPALLFAPLLVGLVSGVGSMFFTKLYHIVDQFMYAILKRVTKLIVIPILFVLISIVGFFFADSLGAGHSLVEALFESRSAWYVLILVFLIRAIGMTVSNTSGATGGIFLPTLAFGALLGALCGNIMIKLGWIGSEHYILMVILGVSAFLGATSRIPLTACVFCVEALGGINNILPIVIATTFALLTVEISGLEDLTDTVIHSKLNKLARGKQPHDIKVPLTVAKDSFVIGKELRDVLWPNSCVVISFNRVDQTQINHTISEGDVITVRYSTYTPASTMDELHALVGEQSQDVISIMNP